MLKIQAYISEYFLQLTVVVCPVLTLPDNPIPKPPVLDGSVPCSPVTDFGVT